MSDGPEPGWLALSCLRQVRVIRRGVHMAEDAEVSARKLVGWVKTKADQSLAVQALEISVGSRIGSAGIESVLTQADRAYSFAEHVRAMDGQPEPTAPAQKKAKTSKRTASKKRSATKD